MESGVFSLIHHTHTAATELLNDAVVRDGLADHSWKCSFVSGAFGACRRQPETMRLLAINRVSIDLDRVGQFSVSVLPLDYNIGRAKVLVQVAVPSQTFCSIIP